MSVIFITEKPAVARTYREVLKLGDSDGRKGYYEAHSSVLDDNVIITWAIGHLITLCPPEKYNDAWGGSWSKSQLPMMPKSYQYEPIENVSEQYDVVESLYTRHDITCIYYAGDSGREGIYIQALIRNQVFKHPPKFDEKVVWISSYSEPSIIEGIKAAKPYSTYQPMIDAGYSRAIADWLIGMNFTRGFTVTSGRLINTGRVVTPTLAMVVQRQEEIDNFKKTNFYGVQTENGVVWKAAEDSKYAGSEDLYNENGFLRQSDADKLIADCNKDKKLTIVNVKEKETKEYAPLLFKLGDLQKVCASALKTSPKETLNLAQALYEAKFITYPRTTSQFLDTGTQAELKRHGYDIPDRYVDDSKVDDHYAVIPDVNGNGLSGSAHSIASISGFTAKHQQLYNIIEKRFLDVMKPPYIYNAVSIKYKHSNGEPFFSNFKNVKQLGWREGEKIDMTQTAIPSKGKVVPVTEFLLRELATKPPVPFTTGTLVTAMETAGRFVDDEEYRSTLKECQGIGTPATRGDVIERLHKNGFITVDKDEKVAPTDLGKAVIPIIAKQDETLVSPIKTAEMEQKLEKIAKGENTMDEYLDEINTYVEDTTNNIVKNQNTTFPSEDGGGSGKTYPCPKCGGDVAFGKYGWWCKAQCGFYPKQKIFGHDLSDKAIEALLAGKKAAITINGKKTVVLPKVVEREFNGKTYYNWQTEQTEASSSGKTYKCPKCGGEITSGQYGLYCKDKCGFYPKQKIFGHELTDKAVESLLSGEKVSLTINGKQTTVLPNVVENEWNGKVYYNWQTQKG